MPKRLIFFRRLVSCALLVATAVLNPLSPPPAHATEASIVIGEVAWAGSSLSLADEWIELWNLTDSAISLGGWSLLGAGESGKTINLPSDAVIEPHATFVIANYGAADSKSASSFEPQIATTTLSLSNSDFGISLLDALGATIDQAGSGKTPFSGSSGTPKTSMLRLDPVLSGSDPLAWAAATSSQNMKAGIADLGTPGVCDKCYITTQNSPEPIDLPATSTLPLENATSTPLEEAAATTTADSEIPASAATTTEETLETMAASVSTSTAEAALEPLAVTTSTESSSSPETLAIQSVPSSPPVPPKPNYGMLRLNEVMSYPMSGKEWIEITTLDASNSLDLKGCMLFDGQGKIYTFKTKKLDPLTERYLKVELSTARLNNSGDSISLYSPDNKLLDTVTFPKMRQGNSWMRNPMQPDVWVNGPTPSPASPNILVSENPANSAEMEVESAAEASIEDETIVSATAFAAATASPALSVATSSNIQIVVPTNKTATKSTKTKTSKTKTSTKVQSDPIIPFTFAMLQDLPDEFPIHVSLAGTVGSVPGLLTGHSFVLNSPEGRGISVSTPTSKKLPDFGANIRVTGKLYVNDKGIPYLKMGTKDTIALQTGEVPKLRGVDLTAPSNEDAWALMSVTGTVKGVSGRTIKLDLGDAEVDFAIRPVVKYRPQRLAQGDMVNVTGVLDLTKDEPRILPRTPEEITLLKHAEPKAAAITSTPILPGWTPLGAAAGAIALTESAKHLHRRRKQKQLEKKLAVLTQ